MKKNLKIHQHLAQLQARTLIVPRALYALTLSCWKTMNLPDIWC